MLTHLQTLLVLQKNRTMNRTGVLEELRSAQYMAKVEHYLVSTVYRLRGEKGETISLKSHVALSQGVRYQLQSNPLYGQ